VWVFLNPVLSELHGCCHDRLLVISKSAIRSSLSVLRRYWLILRTSRSFRNKASSTARAIIPLLCCAQGQAKISWDPQASLPTSLLYVQQPV